MAEEIAREEKAPAERPKRSAKGTSEAPGGGAKRVLAWVALALLGVFVCVQLAGVLLRDPLERRRPLLLKPPAAEAPPAGAAAVAKPAGPEPSRFGPEVQEVTVAKADAPAPPATPAVAAPPAAPPPAAKSEKPAAAPAPAAPKAPPKEAAPAPPPKAERPAPATKAAPEAREPAPAPSGKGNRVLMIDTFLSQQYLQETEKRLKALGLPSMRTEFQRKGGGFKVVVPAEGADREKAVKAIAAEGFLASSGPQGVEAYFYYKREAKPVADALAKRGIQATVEAVDGPRPYWRLLAGPFSEEEAKKAQQRLSKAGVSATLETLP